MASTFSNQISYVRVLTGVIAVVAGSVFARCAVSDWPELPVTNAGVYLPAQEWPARPGPRTIAVQVHFPGGSRRQITQDTGIALTLHNWGGTNCVGTADPQVLAGHFNTVALCVNYVQSGRADSIDGPEPYDFGYLQALDALRALWWTRNSLIQQSVVFATNSLFATGGSGGGNVTLMCQKLAPRTFLSVADLCGMKRLSDDIAFHLPGGSDLNARYSRDPQHPNYLPPDAQELRDLGNPTHLRLQKSFGSTCRVITVHGVDDTTCPFEDAVRMVEAFKAVELPIEPHFIRPQDLDGNRYTSSGHALGDRTAIVIHVAHAWSIGQLTPATAPTDFDRRGVVRYPTRNGAFEIDFAAGYPVGRFVATR